MSPILLKDNMPALQNKAYFNYGGQGPLPTQSLNAITSSWQTIQNINRNIILTKFLNGSKI